MAFVIIQINAHGAPYFLIDGRAVSLVDRIAYLIQVKVSRHPVQSLVKVHIYKV